MVEVEADQRQVFCKELTSFFSLLDQKANGEDQISMGLSQRAFGVLLIKQLFHIPGHELPKILIALSTIPPQLYWAAEEFGFSLKLSRR